MKRYSKKGLIKRKERREGYAEFYKEKVSIAARTVCENCGRRLFGHSSEIAHILPKNLFPSVATNPNNCLYLCSNYTYGSDGCHDKYDSSWTAAKSMSVWAIAIERFEKFEEFILESNRKTLNHFRNGKS